MDARRRAVRHPREVYGWSRMACWCLLALPYVDAALGKVRAGNLNWLQADNLRSWLYMDNLLEKGFNFDGGLRLLHAPDWVFSAFATFCVVVEFSALLLLFLPLARRIVPWLLIALHLGILLFQNIPFFDLMIMPLIFVDWSKWTARLTVPDASPAAAPAYRYQALVLASVLFVLAPWKHNIEIYPLTGWKMYAGAQLSGVTGYESVRAILASGRIIPFEPGAAISVLRFGYHRGILPAAFDPARSAAFGRLLEECASRHNRNAVPDDRITGFLIERKTWDFRTQRDDPNFGTVIDSAKFLMPAHAN